MADDKVGVVDRFGYLCLLLIKKYRSFHERMGGRGFLANEMADFLIIMDVEGVDTEAMYIVFSKQFEIVEEMMTSILLELNEIVAENIWKNIPQKGLVECLEMLSLSIIPMLERLTKEYSRVKLRIKDLVDEYMRNGKALPKVIIKLKNIYSLIDKIEEFTDKMKNLLIDSYPKMLNYATYDKLYQQRRLFEEVCDGVSKIYQKMNKNVDGLYNENAKKWLNDFYYIPLERGYDPIKDQRKDSYKKLRTWIIELMYSLNKSPLYVQRDKLLGVTVLYERFEVVQRIIREIGDKNVVCNDTIDLMPEALLEKIYTNTHTAN